MGRRFSIEDVPLLVVGAWALGAGPVRGQVFGDATVIDSSKGTSCVVSADLDGDGSMDLVAAEKYGSRVVWFPQLEPGKWGPERVIEPSLSDAVLVRAVDLDGDGDVDVISGGRTYSPAVGAVDWYENAGDGTGWLQHQLDPLGAEYVEAIEVVDIDLDGDKDILAITDANDSLFLFENLGGGVFAAAATLATFPGELPWVVGTADLDGDGLPELLAGCNGSDQLYSLWNLGGGAFASPALFASAVGGPTSLSGHDLDGDGDEDVLYTAKYKGVAGWFENDGQGGLGPPMMLGKHSGAMWATAADIDADGELDIFVASSDDDTVAWYEGLGGGSFGPKTAVTTQLDGAYNVVLADLDGDWDLDLVAPGLWGEVIHVYHNILPLVPVLTSAEGLHCVESGEVWITGVRLAGATVAVDGQPAVVVGSTASTLGFLQGPHVPGGRCDVELTNSGGMSTWPGALLRWPVLTGPPSAALGAPLELTLENGDAGVWLLAVSNALWPTPAPFVAQGWYHGLELNGVWLVGTGSLAGATTTASIVLPGATDPGLAGATFYFQALTSQVAAGYVGFTAVVPVAVQ